MRIAINGFGRIGRLITRAFLENKSRWKELELVAINTTATPEQSLHMLKYDSSHATMATALSINGHQLQTGSSTVEFLSNREIGELPWQALAVDLVLECTGRFNSKELSMLHIENGAGYVLVSAPTKNVELTAVYGVNHRMFNKSIKVVSNASCTTNCLAPVVQILDTSFGVENGFATTVHATTNDQSTVDARHTDWRRGRAASVNMIPTSTGAAKAVGFVLPHLAGKIDGAAIRVPTINVSIVDLVFQSREVMSLETLKREIINHANKPAWQDVLSVCEEPLVSSDFISNHHSAIIDMAECKVLGEHTARVMAWYDNEWGFAYRMLDMAQHMSKHI